MITLAEWAIPLLDTGWPPGTPITHDQPTPAHLERICIGGALMELLPIEVHSTELRDQLAEIVGEWLVLREAQMTDDERNR